MPGTCAPRCASGTTRGAFFPRFARGELTFDQMRRRRLTEVADHLGQALPEEAFAEYDRTYGPALERAQSVFPDVRPFLDHCVEHGLAVGALTNSSAGLTAEKLAATGTADWFEVVVTRDDLGYGKPDPRVFWHACAELGVEPTQTVYVGDEFEADVRGAAGAGLRPVWVRRAIAAGGHERPHQGAGDDELPSGAVVVSDLTTLPDQLDLRTLGSGR